MKHCCSPALPIAVWPCGVRVWSRFSYKGVVIDNAIRADLIVEGALLIELKSTERGPQCMASRF